MWLLGGYAEGHGVFDGVTNTIWSSSDGTSWSNSTPTDPSQRWSKREQASALIFNDKLWVIGGNADRSFQFLGAPYNDVWSSDDGEAWTQVTASAAFNGRTQPAAFVYNNKLWIAGGKDNSGHYLNDVWNSSDGATWTKVNVTQPFTPRSGERIVANKDELIMIGGETGEDSAYVLNDMWVSDDGAVTWKKIESGDHRALPANFPARANFSMFVQDDAIWIMGGHGKKNGTGQWTFLTDVWKGSLVKTD